MSFDIYLLKNGKPVEIERHTEGGTYCLGGTESAELNVTYNYSQFFYESLDKKKGFRWLYKKRAKKTIGRLEKAIKELGTKQHSNYWEKTPGNAGYALSILLKWAERHPRAIWEGD